ncbi:glycosyltransferase family 4 protein [Rhodocaloribacter litoris]|nr:glycosyltransferase family 4 protein [Rhodocaloribacter litoris]
MLKFVKYLPGCGWAPVVLTVRPEDASYPALDPSLEREVPPAVPVVRTRAWDPYALYARLLGKDKSEAVGVGFTGEGVAGTRHRLGRWLRANLFLPDARVGWVPFALRAARRLHREAPFEVVVTTGPPHSTHFVGFRMRRAFGVPWVADFRDPWTDISWYGELPFTPWARRLDARLERVVLDAADHVVTVSPALAALLARKTATPITVIPNGFDPPDFDDVPVPPRSGGFELTHVGTLSPSQNPEALWRALRRGLDAGELPALRLRFVGKVDPVVLERLAAFGLAGRVEQTPYVPHAEAVGYMKAADLLLLSINRTPGAEGIVTGKLYEYVASGRPVLGIGPVTGDAAAILRETGAGQLFDYEDVTGIAACVARHYAAWAAGQRAAGADPVAAGAYTREALTRRLAGVLEAVAGKRPAVDA